MRIILEALECDGCDEPIMVEIQPMGIELRGHPPTSPLCEISYEAAVDAANGVIPRECRPCHSCGGRRCDPPRPGCDL